MDEVPTFDTIYEHQRALTVINMCHLSSEMEGLIGIDRLISVNGDGLMNATDDDRTNVDYGLLQFCVHCPEFLTIGTLERQKQNKRSKGKQAKRQSKSLHCRSLRSSQWLKQQQNRRPVFTNASSNIELPGEHFAFRRERTTEDRKQKHMRKTRTWNIE